MSLPISREQLCPHQRSSHHHKVHLALVLPGGGHEACGSPTAKSSVLYGLWFLRSSLRLSLNQSICTRTSRRPASPSTAENTACRTATEHAGARNALGMRLALCTKSITAEKGFHILRSPATGAAKCSQVRRAATREAPKSSKMDSNLYALPLIGITRQ